MIFFLPWIVNEGEEVKCHLNEFMGKIKSIIINIELKEFYNEA